jgi:hypothetical protein
MTCSIETLLDLKDMSIEELSGRLAASEGRGEPEQDAGGQLLLTEEEWRARQKNGQPGEGSSGNGGKSRVKGKKPQKDVGGTSGGGGGRPPRHDGKCHNCGIEGHWARECRKPKRDKGDRGRREEQAYLEQGQEDAPALLLAAVEAVITHDKPHAPSVALVAVAAPTPSVALVSTSASQITEEHVCT